MTTKGGKDISLIYYFPSLFICCDINTDQKQRGKEKGFFLANRLQSTIDKTEVGVQCGKQGRGMLITGLLPASASQQFL